jgi:cycloeucalenol cycloisomerase
VWIAVFSYIGNYFWTHYFFKLLGAAYTMPAWKLNEASMGAHAAASITCCYSHASAMQA